MHRKTRFELLCLLQNPPLPIILSRRTATGPMQEDKSPKSCLERPAGAKPEVPLVEPCRHMPVPCPHQCRTSTHIVPAWRVVFIPGSASRYFGTSLLPHDGFGVCYLVLPSAFGSCFGELQSLEFDGSSVGCRERASNVGRLRSFLRLMFMEASWGLWRICSVLWMNVCDSPLGRCFDAWCHGEASEIDTTLRSGHCHSVEMAESALWDCTNLLCL